MTFTNCTDIVNIELKYYKDMVKLLSALVVALQGQTKLDSLNLETPNLI